MQQNDEPINPPFIQVLGSSSGNIVSWKIINFTPGNVLGEVLGFGDERAV